MAFELENTVFQGSVGWSLQVKGQKIAKPRSSWEISSRLLLSTISQASFHWWRKLVNSPIQGLMEYIPVKILAIHFSVLIRNNFGRAQVSRRVKWALSHRAPNHRQE